MDCRVFVSFFFVCFFVSAESQLPKGTAGTLVSVIYDFDGLDIGQNDLPDGDFGSHDLKYEVAGNPLNQSDVLGDRVLKINLNWNEGFGEFGKATMRFVELNSQTDKLNFFFFNPAANSSSALVKVIIEEDDNQNDIFEFALDDRWVYNLTLPAQEAWQLISIPLKDFIDDNSGGDGIFNAAYSNAAGMLFSVSFSFSKPAPGASANTYYVDMICFTNGDLPSGNSILELPQAALSNCPIGALSGAHSPDGVPGEIEGFLPDGKKLAFVNWFMYYSNDGTNADDIPGTEVQNLLDQGYVPLITWEMMYLPYSRLDPAQPRLDKILNGSFDPYIDQFANKIKTYNGTVIMRIFHEFEGDWYCWSLTENGKDPQKYISAYRHVVDRFRAAGATNVQWMWCVNAEPKPYKAYNWIVNCYPGDAYVDIVATDIYNHPDLGTPAWKSFRYTYAEVYYILTHWFGEKPLYIAEVASRERYSWEQAGSQTKGDWICQMNKDLQSYFPKTKALIFFSLMKEHDWRINSSDAALHSFVDCLWNQDAYGGPVYLTQAMPEETSLHPWPIPFHDHIRLYAQGMDSSGMNEIRMYDLTGRLVFSYDGQKLPEFINFDGTLASGMYILYVKNDLFSRKFKLVGGKG
jgi:hypothetical protein